MKRRKTLPVGITYNKSGNVLDVINEFIHLMSEATGGSVDLDVDLKGKVTIYFESDIKPEQPEIRPDQYDLENLLYRSKIYNRNS